MAFSFLEYLFVLERFTFLYYANKESEDVIGGSLKTVRHSIKNISRNMKVVFELCTKTVHNKRNKVTPIVPLP